MTATGRTKQQRRGNLLDGSLLAEELRLELRATDEGIQRYRDLAARAERRGEAASLKPVERLMSHWFQVYCAAIRKEQRQTASNRQGSDRGRYGPYIGLISDAKMAVLAMHEVLGMLMATDDHRGVPALKVAIAVGRAINGEVNLIAVRADEDAWYELTHTSRSRLMPKHINRIANKQIEEGMRWPIGNQISLGAVLIKLLIETASTVPYVDGAFKAAFRSDLHREGKRQLRWLRMDDEAHRIIAEGHLHRQHMRPRYMPMVHLPLEWSETNRGGYLRLTTPLIKRLAPKVTSAPEAGPRPEVYEGMNAMTRTPWKVNRRVYETMAKLYASGGGYAGMVQADNIPKPPVPPEFESNPEIKAKWKKEAAAIHRRNRQLLAQRVTFLHMLDRAKQFLKHERIYFPHQLDFRGRAYPIPLYLNHHGDDMSRALLSFADAKAPGKNGRRWLMIHAANCCGVDKVSFDQRAQWTRDNIASFEGWADAPLENTGWMNTEKPWQTLAAAFALAHKEDAACLPVQLDGTCNGLQHYAALSRDQDGAEAVNLAPGETPADVYSRVAAEVSQIVERDADNSDRTYTRKNGAVVQVRQLAQSLVGTVNRKLVKTPVMTSVYGVTDIGAREQIQEKLVAPLLDVGKDRRGAYRETYDSSVYLADVVMEAIGRVCLGAGRMMSWLRECASIIVRDEKSLITWTTPLGLKVEQAYRNVNHWEIPTCLGRFTVAITRDNAPPLIRRQINGFAPNFIHSIDASHMLLSATACQAAGLAFAAVHDSYWTHAADVTRMAALLRDQFVALHSQPIVERMAKELADRWPDARFPAPPTPGQFDISAVRDSDYFFS